MLRVVLMSLLLAAPALAEGWRPLTSAEIQAALSGRSLVYEDGTTQNFFSDGRTLYRAGADAGAGESWGKWWVAGDQYCSTWPPSETPACYDVEAEGQDVRFRGGDGSVSSGHYADP